MDARSPLGRIQIISAVEERLLPGHPSNRTYFSFQVKFMPRADWFNSKKEFRQWAKDREIYEYVDLINYTVADIFSDLECYGIRVATDAPPEVKTLLLLTFGGGK